MPPKIPHAGQMPLNSEKNLLRQHSSLGFLSEQRPFKAGSGSIIYRAALAALSKIT